MPCFVLDDKSIEKLTGFHVHRGALAALERPVLQSPRDVLARAHRVIVMEDLADHTNVGGAFRAAAALGFDAVLLSPRCADPLYRRAIKVSMGSVFWLPYARVDDWYGAPELLREAGFTTYAMAVGCARAALEDTRRLLEEAGVVIDYDRPVQAQSYAAATFIAMEADWEAAQLLTLAAAWLADNRKPNPMEASMAKAKAGRVGNQITLRCVELAGTLGYSETELVEKWSRDSKILDIFEGTQQIQQLIVARRLLNLTSSELR